MDLVLPKKGNRIFLLSRLGAEIIALNLKITKFTLIVRDQKDGQSTVKITGNKNALMYLYVLCLRKDSQIKGITKMYQQQEIYFKELTQCQKRSNIEEILYHQDFGFSSMIVYLLFLKNIF